MIDLAIDDTTCGRCGKHVAFAGYFKDASASNVLKSGAAPDAGPVSLEALRKLRERLHKGITDKIDHVHLNGHPTLRLPNTLNLSFAYVEGESILLSLDLKGIAVSTGSACTSGTLDPSHVLMAMGVDPVLAQGSLRFSLGAGNTEKEIDTTVECLVEAVEKLRKLSPLSSKKAGSKKANKRK